MNRRKRWVFIFVIALWVVILIWIGGEHERATRASAVAGAVVATATVVLVCVTWQYVVLTRKLVEQNERQAQQIKAREETAEQEKVRTLEILCHQLIDALAQLPMQNVNRDSICAAPMLYEDNVQQLHNLLPVLGMKAKDVSDVAVDLQWVTERVSEFRNMLSNHAQLWNKSHMAAWPLRLNRLLQKLRSISEDCTKYLDSFSFPARSR